MTSFNRQSVRIPVTSLSLEHNSTQDFLYGCGETAIILSNMDTNDQTEWDGVVEGLVADPTMIKDRVGT